MLMQDERKMASNKSVINFLSLSIKAHFLLFMDVLKYAYKKIKKKGRFLSFSVKALKFLPQTYGK